MGNQKTTIITMSIKTILFVLAVVALAQCKGRMMEVGQNLYEEYNCYGKSIDILNKHGFKFKNGIDFRDNICKLNGKFTRTHLPGALEDIKKERGCSVYAMTYWRYAIENCEKNRPFYCRFFDIGCGKMRRRQKQAKA